MSTMQSTVTAPATNMLSIRQAIAGPAPPQSYARLCKAVLQYRQKRVYALAFASVAVLLPAAALPIAGLAEAILALILPTAWLYLAVGWAGTLPVFVARKRFLSIAQKTWPNRFSQYRAQLVASQTRWIVLAYLLSSSFLTYSYILLVGKLAPTQSFYPFVRTPGRDLYSLNERFLYLYMTLSGSVLAYAARQITTSRHVLPVESKSLSIPARLQERLWNNFATLPSLAASVNITFLGLYLLFKRSTLRFVIYTLPGGRLLRPYLLSLLRVNHVSASLILASVCASLASLLILEVANTLADVYYSQPVSVSAFSSEPRRTLLDGLQSRDPYIQRFAYLELRQLTLTSKARRAEVFSDIKTQSFQMYSRQCLTTLGMSYRTLKGRGQRAAPQTASSSAPASRSPAPASNAQSTAKMPISQENAFRPAPRSFFDTLSEQAVTSTAQASQAASTTAQKLQSTAPTAVSTAVSRVPAIFQRKMQEVVPPKVQEKAAEAKQEASKVKKTVLEVSQGVLPRTITSSTIYRHLFTPLLRHQVLQCLPLGDVDRCAATSLATFMMASLHEDQYGVAQGDIPKVLEAFVLYLDALEGYSRELSSLGEEGQFPSAIVQAQISATVQPTIQVLREGIVGILQTFAAYLDDIRFPPTIARRLQDFV